MVFMKMRPQRIQSALILFTVFLLAVCPAYFYYNDIIEIDFLSAQNSFENPDQENPQADKQAKTKIFIQNPSAVISYALLFPVKAPPRFSPRLISFVKPSSVLRC
jgi:hypothetical protein